ncbi:MAG: tRNA 2-thiouridine(34) synthase MnmA [Simkania sp.]|nr:tRNA 2-thiouridine(34) synthase MnmA [Simkania sp.]
MQKVVVGMSGGVDSSVTALLLKEQGYEVIGLYMKNWEDHDPFTACSSQEDFEDVAKVCDHIGIPYYTVNFVKEYHTQVFEQFLRELKAGHTPNPDILCNREIKFKTLLDKALALGADFLATGHYARISAQNGLLKGVDQGKDQSYFLYTLTSTILDKVLFPIGHLNKREVRDIANHHHLATSKKKDSTGICFIGKRDFRPFLANYIPYQPGNFENTQGKIVGQHVGVAFYTIGQRKGLGIGGPGDAWFVVGKDMVRNVVIIEQGIDHPSLYANALIATEPSWVSGACPLLPLRCHAKIRYRQEDQSCTILSNQADRLVVIFDAPQRAVTSRQSIVFYDKDLCLGGAMIESAIKTLR